jgi:integrase
LWLGDVSKAGAQEVSRHLQRLANATAANTTPHADSLRWARGTDQRIKRRLIHWGLMPESNLETYTISTWVDQYCKDRTDVKPKTILKYKNSRRRLLEVIPDKDLRSVTVADAKRFERFLTGRDSTVGSLIKTIKQIFAGAVDARLLESNPFDGLAASTAIDHTRAAYITPAHAELVLDKIAGQECQLAFLFARYAGLRIPSEIMTLKWTDIDWEANRINIHSPKGEKHQHRKTRLIPLFPRLLKPLTEASEQAADRSIYIIDRYRTSANRELRRRLLAAIKAAKLKPWPKLWMNLRASCRTDLEESFPTHVCDEWLGHSDKIASKHYKRVTPDHFQAALGAVTGAVTNRQ